jgi:hypothetical protein
LLLHKLNEGKDRIQSQSIVLIQNLKKLDAFAKFGKVAPVIVASECCSQQKIRNRLWKHPFMRIINSTIDSANLSETINIDVPQLLDDVKQAAINIETIKAEMQKLIKEYKENYCKPITATVRGASYSRLNTTDSCKISESYIAIDDDVTKAVAIAKKADKDDLFKAINELNDLFAKVDNDKNFYFISTFNQPDGENLKLSMKMTPNAQALGKVFVDSFDYNIPIKGRFKWTIGPSLNFHFGAGLFNETYSIDSARRTTSAGAVVMKDTFNITQNPLRQKLIPYIGVMANFYLQTHNLLTPGIAVGLSTSPTQLSDLRAYLGGALIIGGPVKGKLIINIGFAGAAVDRLKPNLTTGYNPKSQIPFTGDKVAAPEQLVEKQFRVGGFFGLSYNLRD